jgi:UDP-glucose 4-epimerase
MTADSNARIERLAGRRILVTGASGFLGTHLRRRLLGLGAEVIAASRRPAPSDAEGCAWRRADLSDWNDARQLVERARPEFIFHLAGYATAGRELDHVLPALRDNLTATVHLLTGVAPLDNSERIVLPGTFEAPRGADRAASPYAAAKGAEVLFSQWFRQCHALPLVNARMFMTYGPGQPSYKLIPYVVRALLSGESPRLRGGARPVDWVYVDDVVSGLLLLATAPSVEGRSIDLGSGIAVTVRNVIERLAALLATATPVQFGALPDLADEVVQVADVAGTAEAIGWRASTPLQTGLERAVDAIRAELSRHEPSYASR